MASPWALKCTVCQTYCENNSEWINHLLGKEHQDFAKKECRQWGDTVKKCVIVAYCQLPAYRCSRDLLEVFSCQEKRRFVTDFVVWSHRPRVVFIQFESKEKVNEIIPKNSFGVEITFHNQKVQVKKAITIMELEWDEFFPLENPASSRKRKSEKIDRYASADSSPKSEKMNRQMFNGNMRTTKLDFSAQYKEICSQVLIPDAKYNQVINLIGYLEDSLREAYPNAALYLYRHWYLKMKNAGTNELLIYLDTQGIWKNDKGETGDLMTRNSGNVTDTLKDNGSRALYNQITSILSKSGIKALSFEQVQEIEYSKIRDPFGSWFFDDKSRVAFSLVTDRHLILETQTCRLLQYLCTFDPRAIPVLTVIKYWTIVNQIRFSNLLVTDAKFPFCGAEPVSLEWLVVLFLCSKRVIPTIRQILERPHNALIIADQDVGFAVDVNFAKAWAAKKRLPESDTHDFIKSVLSLVQEFFKFYSQLPEEPVLLNTRDAEIIKLNDCLNINWSAVTNTLSMSPSKFTLEEKDTIISNKQIIGKSITMILIHPLCLKYTLSVSDNYFMSKSLECLRLTARKMDSVTFYRNYQADNTNYVDLKSLLSCA